MGLLTILKKMKQKEREMRLLILYLFILLDFLLIAVLSVLQGVPILFNQSITLFKLLKEYWLDW